MNPTVSPTGRWALVGAGLTVSLGLLANSWPALLAGISTALTVLVAFVATVPLSRALRAEHLELAWSARPVQGGAATPGAAVQIEGAVRNRTGFGLGVGELRVSLSPDVIVDTPSPVRLALPAGAASLFELEARPLAAGRMVLHGASLDVKGPLGLFSTSLYFPNPISLKVFPRAVAAGRSLGRPPTGTALDRPGLHFLQRLGGGTDLREIREHRHGDPFKRIAWKATARTGQLMVRELESEIQATRYLLVDVSATMRSGEVGRTKLDFAMETACAFGRLATEQRDRVGLVTFDTRPLLHLAPGEGHGHWLRLVDALLGAVDAPDADLTEPTDAEVAGLVARYLRVQEGIDVRLPAAPGDSRTGTRIDLRALIERVAAAMKHEGAAVAPAVASDASFALLRRFAVSRALRLAYRVRAPAGAHEKGMKEALRIAIGRTRRGATVMLISDLEGIDSWDAVTPTVRLLRARGHRITVVVPNGSSFVPKATLRLGPLQREVATLFARQEDQRIARARSALAALRVEMVVASADDSPARWLQRTAGGGSQHRAAANP